MTRLLPAGELFLGNDGISKVAHRLRGSERLHMGVRPAGFHAGNALALVVYPLLLLRELRRSGKLGSLTLFVSINDCEPTALAYPRGEWYPNNVVAGGPIFELAPDPDSCCPSLAQHHEPIIRERIGVLKEEFPDLSLEFVRNSELRVRPEFRSALIETLKRPAEIGECMSDSMRCPFDPRRAQFAGAVCPVCGATRGKTSIDERRADLGIRFGCAACGTVTEGNVDDFRFWWHYAALRAARAACFRFDVHLTGGDHVKLGDLESFAAVLSIVAPGTPVPNVLASPVLKGTDGRKMSKSFGNGEESSLSALLELAQSSSHDSLALPRPSRSRVHR